MADFVWFSAYGFFAFYLYSTYFEFHKKFRFSRRLVVFSIIGAGVFLSYIIAVTTNIADLSSNRGIAMFIVVIAYPVLDSILIVPAVVILLSFRKEPVWFTPWLFESAGIFLMAHFRQLVCTNCSHFDIEPVLAIWIILCLALYHYFSRFTLVYHLFDKRKKVD